MRFSFALCITIALHFLPEKLYQGSLSSRAKVVSVWITNLTSLLSRFVFFLAGASSSTKPHAWPSVLKIIILR